MNRTNISFHVKGGEKTKKDDEILMEWKNTCTHPVFKVGAEYIIIGKDTTVYDKG